MLAFAAPALAFDWSEPHRGLRVAEVVVPGPTRVYVAAIDTCAPGVSFRVTAPSDFGGASRVTSAFADSVGVQLATNGDFFDHDFGMNVGAGESWAGLARVSAGVDTATSGTFAVGHDRVELFPTEVLFPAPEAWMEEVVGGRWTLVRDGVGQYGLADGGFVCSPGLRHPRTIVGQSADGRTVFLLVGDGRGFGGSVGLTCDEAIDLLLDLGAANAMGLDGGGSSTMVLDGEVLNLPTDGRERSVLDHVGVYALGDGPAPHCGEHGAAAWPSGPQASVVPAGPAGRLVLGAPTRLVDTRAGAAGVRGGAFDAAGRLTGEAVVAVGGSGGTVGALLQVTATEPLAAGFLATWPDGTPSPPSSSVNFEAGESVGNAVLVGVGAGGVRVRPSAPTHLVVDRQGLLAASGLGFVPVAPERVLDTRAGAPLAAGQGRRILDPLGGAVTLSVVAVDPQGPGFVTVWPCDDAQPGTSNLNFDAGEVAAASVTVDASRGGVCASSLVETDLVVDATGAWSADGLAVQPVAPARLLDTRTGEGRVRGRVRPGDDPVRIELGALPGWPADGQAVAVVATVTEPTEDGFLQLWPCDQPRPATSTSNYRPGQTVAVSAILGVGGGRALCAAASASTHLVVDLGAVLVGAAVDPDATLGEVRAALPDPADAAASGLPDPDADPVVAVTAPPTRTGCAQSPGGASLLPLLLLALRRRR